MKQPLKYYSIGQVAEMLNENTSLVRYWSNKFPRHFKLPRSPKGNRRYTEDDIAVLKRIQHLVDIEGLTLAGVEKMLSEESPKKKKVEKDVQVLESLRDIREQLAEVKKML
jgi:DNA-binding transcriptional MerR regulator